MKYALYLVSLIAISSTIYAFSIETDPQSILEKENRKKFSNCLESLESYTGSLDSLRKEINKCENLEIRTIWTGNLAPTTSEPPSRRLQKETNVLNDATWVLLNAKNTIENKSADFWKTYNLAIPLIQKYEWLHLKAYPDYKGCSIGWWTRAKSCKEKITQAEADKRLGFIVQSLVKTVQKDFPDLHSGWQAGLVSFAYNCHKGYVDVKKYWLWQHKFWCRTAWGEIKQWLVNRRLEEQSLIFK